MSLGNFSSLVRIHRSCFGCGFSKGNSAVESFKMELEGKLLKFNYGDLKEKKSRDINTVVFVQIEFTKDQEVHSNCDEEDQMYIGTIQFNENEIENSSGIQNRAIVNLTLPSDMHSRLSILKNEYFYLDTIHDFITNPTEDQKLDNVVAFVKRVYFEESYDL